MYTVVKDGTVLGETWREGEEVWIPFHDVVREAGTSRSFARLPSEESAEDLTKIVGGRAAEVLVLKGTDKFEIVLSKPYPGRVRSSGR